MTHTMAQQQTVESTNPAASADQPRGSFSRIIPLVLLFALGLVVIYADKPPGAVAEPGPAGRFSAQRAMKHVLAISKRPHPVGSAEHLAVQDYILRALGEAGVPGSVRKATAVSQTAAIAASTENIIARLPGSGTGKSVLLVAHYDSVPTSLGASDDGAGVAVLLETAQILKSLPQMKRDVLFLFTDGEELGLLGAQAFVAEDPHAANVGVVLNFEARGTSGAAILFETSDHNRDLIRTVSNAARFPVANSLSYEIYKRLPNDTDFSVFKRAGYSGLNFAFIDGLVHYHTLMDNYENLDHGSLQHEGDYAVELTRRLGDSAQDTSRAEGNAVYFDILGWKLISYSTETANVLIAVTALLLIGVLGQGFKKNRITLKGLLFGTVIMILGVVAAGAASFAAQYLVMLLAGRFHALLAGEFYNSGGYVAAFATLGLATALLLYTAAAKRIGLHNLAVSGQVIWFILLIVVSMAAPGGSYLLLWPLMVTLVAWNVKLWRNDQGGGILLLNVAAAAAVILVVPMLHKILIAFDLGSHLIVTPLLALLAGLCLYQLIEGSSQQRLSLPGVLYISGSALLLSALFFSPRFDHRHPRLDSILYEANENTGSIWASYDNQPDEWTSQIFRNPIQRQALPELFPGSQRRFMQAPADSVPLPAPSIEILESKTLEGERQLHLRVASVRHAPSMVISMPGVARVTRAAVNGHEIRAASTSAGIWTLQYYGVLAEGIDLVLDLKSTGPVTIHVADVSYDLPEAAMALKPRPEASSPSPVRFNESTVVAKALTIQ